MKRVAPAFAFAGMLMKMIMIIIIIFAAASPPQQMAVAQVDNIQIFPEPELVGPATKLTVLIFDGDLDANPNNIDEYESDEEIELVTFRTDRSELGEAAPDIKETGKNTGIFSFTLQLETDKESCNIDRFIDPSFEAEGGSEPSIGACPGDVLSIRYKDFHTATGDEALISFSIEIRSWDPEFFIKKQSYSPQDRIAIDIFDPDANRDPDIADSIRDIRVYSESDVLGEEFSAIETGRDTGVFRLTFLTSLESRGNAIQVKEGDELTVEYTDEFPADPTAMDKTFAFVMVRSDSIGDGIGDGIGVEPSTPKVTANEETLAPGNQIMLSVNITNPHSQRPQPFVEIIEVRDSSGATVFSAWQSGILDQLGQTNVGILWTPEKADNYEIRTFAISDFENPRVLSQVQTTAVTIYHDLELQ